MIENWFKFLFYYRRTFSEMLKLILRNTKSPSWEYFSETFLNLIVPRLDQAFGSFFRTSGSDSRDRSTGSFVYSMTLSTDVIWFSNSAVCRNPQLHIPIKLIAWVIARPTLEPIVSGWRKRMLVTKQLLVNPENYESHLILELGNCRLLKWCKSTIWNPHKKQNRLWTICRLSTYQIWTSCNSRDVATNRNQAEEFRFWCWSYSRIRSPWDLKARIVDKPSKVAVVWVNIGLRATE